MSRSRFACVAASLAILSVACSAAPADDEADLAQSEEATTVISLGPTPIAVTPMRDPLLSSTLLDRGVFRVFTTSSEYIAATGHDLPGVRWNAREWVVLFAPGRSMLWSHPAVDVRASQDRTHFTIVRKLNRPGHGCTTPDFPEAHGPYALAKFTASSGARIGFVTWRDDTTFTPCDGPVDWGCAWAGCSGNLVCRLVDGHGTCVTPPPSCDDVACGASKGCGIVNDHATCLPTSNGGSGFSLHRPSFGGDCVTLPDDCGGAGCISFPSGSSCPGGTTDCVSFPNECTARDCISFPDTGSCPSMEVFIPAAKAANAAACSLLHCRAGSTCSAATGRCVRKSITFGGIN